MQPAMQEVTAGFQLWSGTAFGSPDRVAVQYFVSSESPCKTRLLGFGMRVPHSRFDHFFSCGAPPFSAGPRLPRCAEGTLESGRAPAATEVSTRLSSPAAGPRSRRNGGHNVALRGWLSLCRMVP